MEPAKQFFGPKQGSFNTMHARILEFVLANKNWPHYFRDGRIDGFGSHYIPRDSIHPSFASVLVSHVIQFRMPNIMGFPSLKNPAFLRVHTNIVTEPWWEKQYVGVVQPLFSPQQKVGERK
jgi:hypothetical protein